MTGSSHFFITLMWTAGLVGVAAMLPMIVYSLHHLLKVAGRIEQNAADALAAGAGIAGHTAQIAALDQTLDVAGAMVAAAGRIERTTGAMGDLLASRAGRGR